MPYIKQEDRAKLQPLVDEMRKLIKSECTPGELNYLMSTLAVVYLEQKTFNYSTLNEIVGAFESAKAEFERRLVAPYEDVKIEENGDIY